MSIFLSSLSLVAGLLALVFAADRFVDAAAALARGLRLPASVIGLTVVGFGSAAPELLVAGIAALQGSPQLALGNALGSNVTNFTGVLGVVALASPLLIPRELLFRDLALLLGFIVLAVVLILDGVLGRVDGVVLLVALGLYLYASYRLPSGERGSDLGQNTPSPSPDDAAVGAEPSVLRAAIFTLLSLAILIGGAHLLVSGATSIARALGVGEVVIGLTIVAFGTSLPELTASIAAARAGHDGLAIGNLIGANIYNVLAVLGVPAVIAGVRSEPTLMVRDLPLVLGALALFGGLALLSTKRRRRLGRAEGALLTGAYLAYLLVIAS